MQSQNGDVQLSVTLDTKGIKSDVQKLKNEIQKEVDRRKTSGQDSTTNAGKTVEEIKEVETEMEKLSQMKKELASGELSMDTQSELDRLQAILDKKKQSEQITQEQLTTEQQVVENTRSAADVYREVAETQAQVQREMEQMQSASAGVAESQQQVVEDCSLAVREVERMKTALSDTNAVATDLAYDLSIFEQGNKYSDDFVRLSKIAQDLTKEFNKSADELFKMETLGDRESAEFSELAIKTAEIADQLRDVNGLMDDMRQSGEAYTEGVNTAELKNVERAYDAITNKITLKKQAEKEAAQQARESARQEAQATRETEKEQARLTKEAQKTGKAVQQAGNQGTRAMKNTAKETKKLNKEMKQTNTHGRKLKLNFLNILGAAIGIRSLYALFNKLRSAVTDTVKTIAQMNNGNNKTNESVSLLMNSLNQLKNALGAAFMPILTLVAPALNQLINLITQAVNAIAQLIAYLSGSNTWLKAKKQSDNYAKSLNKTGAAAKNAAGKLAAFDDLNVLGKDDDSNGGGAGGIDPNSLFEEVPIESWVEELFAKLKDLFNKLLPILEHLWEVFKQGFLDAFKNMKERLNTILNNLKRIKDALINIFTDPEVVQAFKKYIDSVVYLLGSLVGSVASILTSIISNLTGGIAKWLESDSDDIKQFLTDILGVWTELNLQVAEFLQAIANIATVLEGSNAVGVTANILSIFAGLFGDITLLASKLGLDLVELITQPIIDNQEGLKNAFDGILNSLKTLTDGIKRFTDDMGEAWNGLYDNHIGPFIDSLTTGVSDIVQTILNAWDTDIQPILTDASIKLSELLNNYIKPFCEDVLEIVGQIIDILKLLWQRVISPFIQWLIATILPVISPIINGIINLFIGMRELILSVITFITGLLKTLLGYIRDGFAVGWDKAWENMQKTFSEVWNRMLESLKGAVNTIMDGVELVVNGVVRAINKLVDAINGLGSINIPGVGEIGGNFSYLEEISLPRLAQGAVIPPNKEFLAMLGDQRQGTNIEAPLDTIRDAFADVVSNMQVQNTGYAQMELDGETFARLIVPYVISELNRQGFDLSVIGA